MNFEEAIKKSIKSFMSGKLPEKLREVQEQDFYYTPEYFDLLEEDLDENSEPSASKKKEDMPDEV
jgi:hypothetical protein